MIAILDYGVGNIFSLYSSLKYIGADAVLTDKVEEIKSAKQIILPGVGAFADAALKLKNSGLDEVVKQQVKEGKPLMGICLGMQMLFERSFEYGEHKGLGLIEGDVMPISDDVSKGLKIPHIGWNALCFPKDKPKNEIFKYINERDCVYFVHSYYGKNCEKSLIATTEYEIPLTAAVAKDNVYGMQFHPEKSGAVGLNILKAFSEL